MGGNAIPNSERLVKEEYQQITNQFIHFMNILHPNEQHGFPPAYREKETFGDLDFLTTISALDMYKTLFLLEERGVIKVEEFQYTSPSIGVVCDDKENEFVVSFLQDIINKPRKGRSESERITNLNGVPINQINEINFEENQIILLNAINKEDMITLFNAESEGKVKLLNGDEFKKTVVPTMSFGISFFNKDKNTYSDMFQLDMIKTNKDNFDFHYNYLSWNDLGNFIGRVAAYHGFKLGHDGFQKRLYLDKHGEILDVSQYKTQNDTNDSNRVYIKTNLFLSLDWDKSIEFLGFDSERFKKGFNNLEEIAEYVYNSKYFNIKMFELDNRDNRSRARDLKRPNYNFAMDYFQKQIEQGNIKEIPNEGLVTINHARHKLIGQNFLHYPVLLRNVVKLTKTDDNLSSRHSFSKIFNSVLPYYFHMGFENNKKHIKVHNQYPETTLILPNSFRGLIGQYFKNHNFGTFSELEQELGKSIHKLNNVDLHLAYGNILYHFFKYEVPKLAETNPDLKDMAIKINQHLDTMHENKKANELIKNIQNNMGKLKN